MTHLRLAYPGIFSYFGYRLQFAERIALIKEAGFTHTSVWWGDPEELFHSDKLHLIPEIVRGAGLVLENLHVPFEGCNDLWSDSADARSRFTAQHLAWLGDCATQQIPCMVLHVSHGAEGPGPNAAGLNAFRRIVADAEERSIILAVENTRRDDILDYVFESIQSPALRFCYDSSHDWLWGAPRTGSLRRWGHLLVQTHFSDNTENEDRHHLPGEGVVDWPAVAAAFPRDTYTGRIMLEVLPSNIERTMPPDQFLAKARESIEWLAGMLNVRDEGR
jgi:sugar phosphate isomerase/epimerase